MRIAHNTCCPALLQALENPSSIPPTGDTLGIAGYLGPLVLLTAGYGLFQTANNTAVMTDIRPEQRGVISGILNLSRNLSLITGASVIGSVFVVASGTIDITTAHPDAIATGMRITFAIAALLFVTALAIAIGSRALTARPVHREDIVALWTISRTLCQTLQHERSNHNNVSACTQSSSPCR